MRAILFLGAVIVQCFMGVMLLSALIYGVTQTYSFGAAGYNRFGIIGAILALFFLWIVAWFPAMLIGGMMLGFPSTWRDPEVARIQKIKTTLGMIVMMFVVTCAFQWVYWLPLWIFGASDCHATLQDVIAWRWPCR